MKLEKWALIAEIISAVAIVLSLIFVGLQVRQGTEETAANSRAVKATVRESMLNADLSMLQTQFAAPDIATLSRQGKDPTDSDEVSQLTTFNYMFTRTRENYWNQYSDGMLDRDTYLSYRNTFVSLLARSNFHLSIWSANKAGLVPGFVSEIDAELRRRGLMPNSEQDSVSQDKD